MALYPAKNVSNGRGWMASALWNFEDEWISSMLRQDSTADPSCTVFYSCCLATFEFAFVFCQDERLKGICMSFQTLTRRPLPPGFLECDALMTCLRSKPNIDRLLFEVHQKSSQVDCALACNPESTKGHRSHGLFRLDTCVSPQVSRNSERLHCSLSIARR